MPVDAILVHGAWHHSTCWDRVVDRLATAGLAAETVQLPFEGFASDVEAVRSAIQRGSASPVVIAHSYGGAVLSEAVAGAPGVSHLIYLAAFLLAPGERPADYVSPKLAAAMRMEGTNVTVDPARAADVFYNQLDNRTAATMVSQLRGMPIDDPVVSAPPAWRDHPVTYVVCADDHAITVEQQRLMATRAQQVVELPADHSPFLGHPSTIAGLVADRLEASRR